MRNLKIIGSFGASGTKVIDMESGEEIRNIRKIRWTHEAGHIPTCFIELVNVTCEAEGQDITSLEDKFRKFSGKFA